MGDGRGGGAEDDSWTDVEGAPPELVEAVPIRHGMVLGGRYAIEKIIGRGGSGVVVRAHDRDLRTAVAVKIVRAELAGQRVWAERLAREVRLARQIHHPHVCRVFDFQQADGRVFLVMELAEGGTLRDELRSGALAARPLAERIADARAVASALDAIHAAGIVHRDLTPQNLLRMADKRLVLSDFGLATDSSESTSIFGGTVAYMAPEVLRGGKSSFASDIWSLGALMYEIVFGDKPLWSEGAAPEMRAPALGRKLTGEERAVLETCRACTVKEAGRRIGSAGEAGRRVREGVGWRARARRLARSRQSLMLVGALTLAGAVAVGGPWLRQKHQPAPADASPLIVPTGEPADWTDVSTVLAEVPERIHCTRLLPDRRTLRFVWGTPARAEDIDIVTRKRIPSPLVLAAYAEGCPDLSPDGKRLVYQGHVKDGRAFAFVSERSDGKDAVPAVQTAEPSMSSEPTWLADGRTFSYDIDLRHMGAFSISSRHMYVLPLEASRPYVTAFRSVAGNVVFVAATLETGQTQVTGIQLPRLERAYTTFRLADFALDLRWFDADLYYVSAGASPQPGLVKVDPLHHTARRLGRIRRQLIRHPTFLEHSLLFVSIERVPCLAERTLNGAVTCRPFGAGIVDANHCGRDLIVGRETDNGRYVVERVDNTGAAVEVLGSGPLDGSPACLPSGDVWFFAKWEARTRIVRCDRRGCRTLLESNSSSLAVSPDGARLAFTTFDDKHPAVVWMNVDGGPLHTVTETETGCAPGWASARTLWVSRRRDGKIVWTEIDADTGVETGRVVPGLRDCSIGDPDPASPVNPDLPIVVRRQSQLRLVRNEHLTAK
jgi:hypothetical protein